MSIKLYKATKTFTVHVRQTLPKINKWGKQTAPGSTIIEIFHRGNLVESFEGKTEQDARIEYIRAGYEDLPEQEK